LFPHGTEVLVRFNPRDLSRVFVPAPDQSGYLQVPYADLRRPPITLAELERAKSILADNGKPHLQEEFIFKAADQLRKIEDTAAKSTRCARRLRESRPTGVITRKAPAPATKVAYDKDAIPFKGENW
jgi:putative transposase